MKKLKISPDALRIREAQRPIVSEFQAVKLTYEQAMDFDPTISNFEKLTARYGAANQLKTGEQYNGYIAVVYPWMQIDVVYLNGYVRRMDGQDTVWFSCYDAEREKQLREGRCWTVRYRAYAGYDIPGQFDYVWTFRGCNFAKTISELQNYFPEKMAGTTDEKLKDKLVAALLSDDKIVEVTDDEDLVLKAYLGSNSYYKAFFTEVE